MRDLVRLDVVDRVARVTIDRPEKRNAVSSEMWARMHTHLRTLDRGSDVVAVVLTGAGGSFSAGRDLAEVHETDSFLAEEVVAAVGSLRQPTIAAVDGPCLGAGCSLALACDIRLCTPRSQFGIPALRNGLSYSPQLVDRLVRILGPGPAGLLLLGGERWTAADALRHGLADRCTDDLEAETERLVAVLREVDAAVAAETVTALRRTP